MEQKVYYNQNRIWDFDYMEDSMNRERFKEVIELIPDIVTNILDVGCGNGSFLNYLHSLNKFGRLVGIDFSEEALKYVKTEKITGNSSELPFSDQEFDLVTCLEVLEHLSVDEYEKTLNEIRRVSRQFIIISVPNNEDIEVLLVKCPVCQCRFNPFFHKRSFDLTSMGKLFQGAQNILTKESGPVIKYRKLPGLLKIVTQAVKIRLQPEISYCPQCGHHQKPGSIKNSSDQDSRKFLLLKIVLKASRFFFRLHRKKRWILSLYNISE